MRVPGFTYSQVSAVTYAELPTLQMCKLNAMPAGAASVRAREQLTGLSICTRTEEAQRG